MDRNGREGAPPGFAGRGGLNIITAPNPAAGADWTLAPPPGARWNVLGGSAQLVTAAAVAVRQVLILIAQGPTTVLTLTSPNTQAAGLTYTYQLLPGVPQPALVATFPVVALPERLVIDERWRVKSSTTLIQAADQWSAIVLMVEELGPEPPE